MPLVTLGWQTWAIVAMVVTVALLAAAYMVSW
jgi:hypothetical protein